LLPSDLRTLYAWHDGQGDQRDGVTEDGRFGPYWFIAPNISSFWSLERVVMIYQELNRFPEENYPFWQPGWLPFLDRGATEITLRMILVLAVM
jgi:cell wall assembly regulator SMI1